MSDDSQIVVPPSFIALYVVPGKIKPNVSRQFLIERYELCEDLAQVLVEQAKTKQWELGISRGSVYYLPRPVSDADLKVMRRIDELHLEFPFAGSRMLRDLLRQEGIEIGRCHVATLMKKMAIEALYRRPNTS